LKIIEFLNKLNTFSCKLLNKKKIYLIMNNFEDALNNTHPKTDITNLPIEIHIEIIELLNLKHAINYCNAVKIPQELACQYFNFDNYQYYGVGDDEESESEEKYNYWKENNIYLLEFKRILRFCYKIPQVLKSCKNRKALIRNKKLLNLTYKNSEKIMYLFR